MNNSRRTGALILTVAMSSLLAAGCISPRITADPVYLPSPPATAHAVHIKSFNRLNDLVTRRATFDDFLHGRPISPWVGKPAGIAYAADHLYICDTDLNVVHDWNLATGIARRIGSQEGSALSKPVAVAVDSRGTLYVADTYHKEVVAFDTQGRATLRFKPPDRKDYKPTAVAADDSTLYVCDIVSHQVDFFSTQDGHHMGSFGKIGSEPGQFYFPMGLALDAVGSLYLADMMNSRVQVFDPAHKPFLSMGQAGDRYGDMGKPRQVAVGPDGVIFVADAEFGAVHLFNAKGQLLMLLGNPEDKPGGTPMPVGVAVASQLPENLARLVPADFQPAYYLFVSNTVGTHRLNLFAIGTARNTTPESP